MSERDRLLTDELAVDGMGAGLPAENVVASK